ncbi:MAG: ABC transporter ATP-binding protein [Defluviitaleaceae bacterium]|nr:ABC transporter ATP-binding protein [Defluviitaleaceae bacterium]
MTMIRVNNLEKTYPGATPVRAVKGISFNVREGMLFSFLGTNGAGKSTTINILTTLLAKTSGCAEIGGFDINSQSERVRELIGVVFQESVLDTFLSPEENLKVRGSLYGYKGKTLDTAVANAINATGIKEFANRQYRHLSGGQRRRTDIARALIHTPKLLFLDEPTTGLDPKNRRDIWQLIRDLQKSTGMTVFLTTHYMEEAAESDDIAIIHKGEIKAQGTPGQLKEKYARDILKLALSDGTRIEQNLNRTTDALPIIDRHREKITHMEVISGTLDDVFLKITEKG